MSSNKVRRAVVMGMSLIALGCGGLATAGTASAVGGNGYLESGEFGEYYNSNQGGCVWDLVTEDSQFNNNWFVGPSGCAGRNVTVNDNTASYWNRQGVTWDVYTDANYGGVHGWIPAGNQGNYSSNFKNEVSSAKK
ncbi:peptidase inhibitor family I36 protein [Streptomyces ossamyceticus]|nr:peptidase inhibitor family I36 protein [Streptomyces ossamyceticus]